MAPTGCSVDRDDSYELLRRCDDRAPGEPTPLRYAAGDDAGAARVRRLMSDELSGELLRTFAMARRLVAASAPRSSVRRARARSPLYVALGASDLDRGRSYRDRELRALGLRRVIPADAPIIWIEDVPARCEEGRMLAAAQPASGVSDPALVDALVLDQIVSGFGKAILGLVAPGPVSVIDGAPTVVDPLGEGYATFLEVVAAEWRSRDGDRAMADARVVLQAAHRFAAVRSYTGVAAFRDFAERVSLSSGESPRSIRVSTYEVVRDPLVIAAFLHRLAASEVGHRLAPDEIYRPIVSELPPPGISPGRLLGAFRSFQAKLLWAWNRAVLAERPPLDLIDLVAAYADAFPAERAQVIRIFLVTTGGLTVQPGGVDDEGSPDDVASRLETLATHVRLGDMDLRVGLRAAVP